MMYGTRRFGRPGKRIAGRQSGLLSSRVKRNISKRAGFTLIELLVVIAIIALLMAILVPVLRSARNQARAVVCQSNLKQWGQILNLYTQDNEGRLSVTSLHAFLYILRGPFENNDNRRVSSYAGISTEGIRCCPMATAGPGEDAEKGGWGLTLDSGESWEGIIMGGSTFRSWELTGLGSPLQVSYGFNGYLFTIPGTAGSKYRLGETFMVRGSSSIPAFLDAIWYRNAPKSSDDPPSRENVNINPMSKFCINRHNGCVNGLFLDWSVKKIGLKELWTLKWYPDFDMSGEWTRAGGVMPEDWPKWMQGFKDY